LKPVTCGVVDYKLWQKEMYHAVSSELANRQG